MVNKDVYIKTRYAQAERLR